MNRVFIVFLVCFSFSQINSQDFDGKELLEKAISYHDPNSNWDFFNADFTVNMESPNRPKRKSKIKINLPSALFRLEVHQNKNILISKLEDGKCYLEFNGESDLTNEIKEKYNLDCKRAIYFRDYYTYLYGLPMKLKDPGAIVDPFVGEKKIGEKEFWVLKVTYDESVGTDTWYFLFDKKTFALKRYQFFHNELENDGEYIILEDELVVGGIKMPKNRSWFLNSNNKFLGIDRLSIN